MDFVRNDSDIMTPADIQYLLQLIRGPHAADRIVRRAEDKRFDIIFRDLPLKVIKVYIVAAVPVHKF